MAAVLDDPARRRRRGCAGAARAVCRRWAMSSVVRPCGDQAHRPLHLGLGGEVEVGGGLVEEQDRRVDELGPGQAQQLALAGRQRPALLGDRACGSRRAARRRSRGRRRPAPPARPRGRWRRAGRRRCWSGSCPRTGTAPAARSRAGGGRRAGRARAAAMPSTSTAPGGRVVEAGDELDERRLAGAGGADEGDDLAGGDVEVDAAQRLEARARVGERDALEADVAGRGGRGRSGRRPRASPIGVRSSSSSCVTGDTGPGIHWSNTFDSCWIGVKNWSR